MFQGNSETLGGFQRGFLNLKEAYQEILLGFRVFFPGVSGGLPRLPRVSVLLEVSWCYIGFQGLRRSSLSTQEGLKDFEAFKAFQGVSVFSRSFKEFQGALKEFKRILRKP